jgi:hypothetical protein
MAMSASSERLSKGVSSGGSELAFPQVSSRVKKTVTQVRPTGSKGMMQAYGYFVWFAAQRIKPGKGVVCMITGTSFFIRFLFFVAFSDDSARCLLIFC